MLYLSSGVLLVGSSENQLEGFWGRVLTESCALVERKIEFIVGEF